MSSPLSKLPRWTSVCAAVGALAVACGGGGGIGPRRTGSAGSHVGMTGTGEGGEDGSAGSGGRGKTGSGGSGSLVPTGGGGTIDVEGGGGRGRGNAGGIGPSGTGGADLCDLVEQEPSRCPPALCGNGVIDTCLLRWRWADECYEQRLSESCDGTDFGGMTCETFGGFPSGTLRCSSCTIDTSDCNQCMTNSAILRCGVVPIVGDPMSFAMAASDQEVGLAGVAYRISGPPALSFTRLSSELDGISSTPIQDPALKDPHQDSDLVNLAVAPRPSGWVIAGTSGRELFIHAVDAAGQDAGRATLEKLLYGVPYLVPRAGAGPLLVWVAVDAASVVRVRAAVIGDDGISTSTPVDLTRPDEFLLVLSSGGTFLDGVFYVPMVMAADNQPRLRIARISATGTLISVTESLSGTQVNDPTLVAGDGQLHLTFDGVTPNQNYGVFWQALDKTGATLSEPVSLGLQGHGPTVAMGKDTLQIIHASSPGALDLVRIPDDGVITDPALRIAQAGSLGSTKWMDAVRLGPDLVVAWLDDADRLRMARVRP